MKQSKIKEIYLGWVIFKGQKQFQYWIDENGLLIEFYKDYNTPYYSGMSLISHVRTYSSPFWIHLLSRYNRIKYENTL